MGWTGFPIQDGDDWSHVDGPLQQIIEAYNERERAATIKSSWSAGSFDDLEAGDDVQHYLVFRDLQTAIETLAASSYADKDTPIITGSNITEPSPSEDELGIWARANCFNDLDVATLRSKAGLNASGFTRKYIDGTGTLTTAYGLMQAGDIIGAWLFNEMKAALDQMTVVRASLIEPESAGVTLSPLAWAVTMDEPVTTPSDENEWFAQESDSTYAAAYSAFASAWPETEGFQNANSGIVTIPHWLKESVALATNSPSYEHYGTLWRGRVWNNEVPNWVNRAVDVYVYAWAVTGGDDQKFGDHGESVTEKQCVSLGSIASSMDATLSLASYFPTTSVPDQVDGGDVPAQPGGGGFAQNSFNLGFKAIPVIAIDYGVEGGFEYQ